MECKHTIDHSPDVHIIIMYRYNYVSDKTHPTLKCGKIVAFYHGDFYFFPLVVSIVIRNEDVNCFANAMNRLMGCWFGH